MTKYQSIHLLQERKKEIEADLRGHGRQITELRGKVAELEAELEDIARSLKLLQDNSGISWPED